MKAACLWALAVCTLTSFAGPLVPSVCAEPTLPTDAATSTVVLRLDFEEAGASPLPYSTELRSGARVDAVGPNGQQFEELPAENHALVLDGKGAYLRVGDPSDNSQLAFGADEPLTIEAWVKLDRLANGANVYVVGKGRTYESQTIENQNYALRLTGAGGEARPSFLFATLGSADSATNPKRENQKPENQKPVPQYHRWTAERGFAADGQWHHIAVSYRFGAPESIAGYVDGEKVKGKWDMAGATRLPPIVDNDALWVGSSRGGDKGNSLSGAVDELVIHRQLVPAELLTSRRRPIVHPPLFPSDHDDRRVTVAIHSEVSSHSTWPALAPPVQFSFRADLLALHRLPMRYISGGLRQPWRGPLLLRAYCRTHLPGGELTWLLRSPGLSRLWIDGQVVMSTRAHRLFPDAHQPFEVYQADHPWLRVPRTGDHEERIKLSLEPGMHEIVLEQIVGAKNIRCETGDTTVAVQRDSELFSILGPRPFEIPLSDEAWLRYQQQLESELTAIERQWLHETTLAEQAFWNERHRLAQIWLDETAGQAAPVPESTPGLRENNAIDRFINQSLIDQVNREALNTPASDAVFIRRLYLDTVGVLPSAQETRAFLEDISADKRAALIDRLLADDRWADHWTSYWQDVLAENPSILKPTLNNSGPFRWWIYDALLENKPMDRFVTELVRMEGDLLGGAPAGFSMAAENDVPMAAKAHILTAAFLGVEMKCARCHDAPFHPWTQKELFGLAAMLENRPLKVPATSSVPKEFFTRKDGDSPITLSIFPGDEIQPAWPFDDLNSTEPLPQMLDRDNPTRERLAAYITAPHNERFAQVLANRLWQRVMGWGLVTHLGDWHGLDARHAPMLNHLGRELVRHNYDYKALARLILNSHAYQRQAVDGRQASAALAAASPWIRRLTAEQVVDSLHSLAGLPLGTEEITFDPSSQQRAEAFLNLGVARRAWQLTSLSNERDRPSLSLPKAAMVVECLEAFGWRGARQEPVSHRETDANMVQPGVIANSSLSVRVSRMSEESFFTQLALSAKTPEEFVDRAFEQALTRLPSDTERQTFVEQIAPGWNERIVTLALPVAQPKAHRGFVTWANHFDIRANQLMREIELEVAAGPEPSARLNAQWRERAEDAIWALMNTPEFQFIP